MKKEHVFAKASKPRKGPIGFNEPRLSHDVLVRYLLNPGELEGGRRRATDCNWSPQIYHIRESLVQKNQPVLYWLIDSVPNFRIGSGSDQPKIRTRPDPIRIRKKLSCDPVI